MFRRLSFERRLADGSAYRIRPSGPDDRGLLIRCFESLSPQSRRLRFFTERPTLAPDDLDRFCAVDARDHIAFAAVRIDVAGRELEPLGFARCIRLTPGGEVAEFSIATVDLIQGQGVGAALLSHLIAAARRQGIRRFWFEVLAENAGMRRLARQLGGEPHWVGDGTLEYDCRLPDSRPAAPASVPLRPAAHPVVRALPLGLPAYLDPGVWVEPWIATWREGLGRSAAWPPAANEAIGHGVEAGPPASGRRWRAAA